MSDAEVAALEKEVADLKAGADTSEANSDLVEVLAVEDEATLLATLKAVLERRAEVLQALVEWAVPDHALVTTRLFTDHRQQGIVKSFSPQDGYGFIECEDAKMAFGQDVFLHASQMGNLSKGSKVSFAILLNKLRKPQAFDVVPAGHGAAIASHQAAGKAYGACKGGKQIDAGWGKGYEPYGKGGGKVRLHGGKGEEGWKSDAPPTQLDVPGVTDCRFNGVIKSANPSKGYGFITCDDLQILYGGDVFAHVKQLGGLAVGQQVNFAVFLNKDAKPQAKDVQLAEEELNADPWQQQQQQQQVQQQQQQQQWNEMNGIKPPVQQSWQQGSGSGGGFSNLLGNQWFK